MANLVLRKSETIGDVIYKQFYAKLDPTIFSSGKFIFVLQKTEDDDIAYIKDNGTLAEMDEQWDDKAGLTYGYPDLTGFAFFFDTVGGEGGDAINLPIEISDVTDLQDELDLKADVWEWNGAVWGRVTKPFVIQPANIDTLPSGLTTENSTIFKVPDVVENLSTSGISGYQFTADWDALSGVNVLYYLVEVYNDSDGYTTPETFQVYGATSLTVTDRTPNELYKWTVKANVGYAITDASTLTDAQMLQTMYGKLDALAVKSNVNRKLKVLCDAPSGNLTNSGTAFPTSLVPVLDSGGSITYGASKVHDEGTGSSTPCIAPTDSGGFLGNSGSNQWQCGGADGLEPFAIFWCDSLDNTDAEGEEVVIGVYGALVSGTNTNRIEIRVTGNGTDNIKIVVQQAGTAHINASNASASFAFDGTKKMRCLFYNGVNFTLYVNGNSVNLGTVVLTAGGIQMQAVSIFYSADSDATNTDADNVYLSGTGSLQFYQIFTGTGLVAGDITDIMSSFLAA